MRFVPAFIAVLLPAVLAGAPRVHLDACDHSFDPGIFHVDQIGGDSVRASAWRETQWTLVVVCRANNRRTNGLHEVIESAKERGDFVRNVTGLTAGNMGPAIIMRRTARENPITRIEAYFASREFEYRYVAVPENGKNVRPEEWDAVTAELAAMVASSDSKNQKPAIAEEEFRRRLIVAMGVILLMFLILGFVLFRGIVRRKRR